MTELIKALTEMAKAITAHYERAGVGVGVGVQQPLLPFPPAAAPAADVEVKRERKARTPKTVEAPAPVEEKAPAVDPLGLGEAPEAPTAPAKPAEMTEKESAEKLEPITKQYVILTKNDKPEDGKTKAMRMLQTDPRFKVGKLGDLNHAQRVAWINEMEKGIEAHK